MKIGRLRINVIKSESNMKKEEAFANVGESAQAVAISSIYREIGVNPEDIVEIDQYRVKSYDGEPVILPLRLPISSTDVDDYFPLPEQITPVFMSLHLHDDIFIGREDLVEYFKKYQPIGCRDEYTCGYFRKHGIESYIMGCYTLCLQERANSDNANTVYVVDASKELIDSIPDDIRGMCKYCSHAVPYEEYPVTPKEDARLVNLAKEYLQSYASNASMIITSRIHAAAPCIAMGIPVVLATNNADFRYAWIDRFLPIYQLEDYEKIDWAPSIPNVSEVRKLLLTFFSEAVKTGRANRECLVELDKFYRERNKTEYYKCFRNRILRLKGIYGQERFTYAIWGGGCHALFAYDLMSKIVPNAELKIVVDKFKEGTMLGVPIVRGEQLKEYDVDHVCITTNPGKTEALAMCERLKPGDDKYYTIITSQQLS